MVNEKLLMNLSVCSVWWYLFQQHPFRQHLVWPSQGVTIKLLRLFRGEASEMGEMVLTGSGIIFWHEYFVSGPNVAREGRSKFGCFPTYRANLQRSWDDKALAPSDMSFAKPSKTGSVSLSLGTPGMCRAVLKVAGGFVGKTKHMFKAFMPVFFSPTLSHVLHSALHMLLCTTSVDGLTWQLGCQSF